jgi:hypothetical protein
LKKYEELDITDPFIFAKVMSEKGESYDILKESYVIFICTFDFLKKEEVFTSLKMYAWKIVKSN